MNSYYAQFVLVFLAFVAGSFHTVACGLDANGNTVADLNSGITAVTYDYGDRPRSISFDSGAETAYIYSADGVKLRTEHRVPAVPMTVAADGAASDGVLTSVTDYCGPMVYEDGRLDRIQLEGGYLSYTGSSGQRLDRPEYHFYIRDHLGNNRMDIDIDGGVWQTVHYYPFGLSMGEGYRTGSQRWTFGGKEMDRVAGLDLLDFEARAYCPATARFLRPDPLASNYHPISPYAYCANNPLANTDPTGMDWVRANKNDHYEWMDNVNSSKNTPSGYSYIGSKNDDILRDLRMDRVQQHHESAFGLGTEGDPGRGCPMPSGCIIDIYVVTDVDVTIGNKENINLNNINGKTFDGLNISVITNQKSLHTSEDYRTTYDGGMTVNAGGKTMRSPIVPPQDNIGQIVQTGYVAKKGMVHISPNYINRKNIGTVSVELSTLRTVVPMPFLPLKKTYNLQNKHL